MTERTEGFLNAMTIIGLVLVGFVLVVSVALTVMLIAGFFDKHKDPLLGLKFSTTESLVITENEGSVWLTVTANTAVIGEDGAITDNTVDSDIVLKVFRKHNNNNVLDDTIISVPATVKKGVPFEVKAKTLTDGFNKGGVCYIRAETSDTLYQSKELLVQVDVPVDSITMVAKDAGSNKAIDLSTTKFIYEDTAIIGVEVTPARSQYIFGDTTKKKDIIYVSSNPQSAKINKDSGVLEIGYNPVYTDEEPLEEPLSDGIVTITAKINQYSDNSEATQVTTNTAIKLFPLQLGQILIKNENFSGDSATFSAKLFSNSDVLKISAEETGLSDVINLKVFLQPTIVKESQDPDYTPLSDLSQFTVEFEVENDAAPNCVPLDIVPKAVNYDGKSVAYWEIIPNRLIENGEHIWIKMNMLGRSDKFVVKREMKVERIDANVDTFTYYNTNNVEISNVNLQVTRYDDEPENNVYDNLAVNYSYYTDEGNKPSFGKIVTFVGKINSPAGANQAEINKNEVNNQIIVADTDNHQITNETIGNGKPGFVVEALSAGGVAVIPYLVRTNREGLPVDKDYNIITTDYAQWGTAGYIKPAGLCKYDNIDSALPGQYIWYQTFESFEVNVSEKLVKLELYQGNPSESIAEAVPFDSTITMGTGSANSVKVYAVPNSTLALPENLDNYLGNNRYAEIKLAESLPESGTPIFDLKSDFMMNASVYGNNKADEGSEGYVYRRWLQFELEARQESDSIKDITDENFASRTIQFRYGERGSAEQNVKAFYVKAFDVPVDSISVDSPKFGMSLNGGAEWRFTSEILGGTVSHNGKVYQKLNFGDGIDSGLVYVPEATCAISPANELLGARAPTHQNVSKQVYLFDALTLYNIDGIDYTIEQILNMASLPTTDKALSDMLWQKVYQLISESIQNGGGKNPADEYVSIANSGSGGGAVLNIKKELPFDKSLYMFYVPQELKNGNFVDIAFNVVCPRTVRIIYQWPTISGKVSGAHMPNSAYEEIGGKMYVNIYSDTTGDVVGQNTRDFNISELNLAKALLNGGAMEAQVDCHYNVAIKGNLKLTGSEYKIGEEDIVYRFTLAEPDVGGSWPTVDPITIEVEITRGVRFVADCTLPYRPDTGAISWVDLVNDCASNGGVLTNTDYINALDTYNYAEVSAKETIYFVIQATEGATEPDTGEDGSGEGETGGETEPESI